MPAKRRQSRVGPLKLDLAEMRTRLALLKLGKLITPLKKGRSSNRSKNQAWASQSGLVPTLFTRSCPVV